MMHDTPVNTDDKNSVVSTRLFFRCCEYRISSRAVAHPPLRLPPAPATCLLKGNALVEAQHFQRQGLRSCPENRASKPKSAHTKKRKRTKKPQICSNLCVCGGGGGTQGFDQIYIIIIMFFFGGGGVKSTNGWLEKHPAELDDPWSLAK